MEFVGIHSILDATNIKSFSNLIFICTKAIEFSGATILNMIRTPFPGGGESIIFTLSESHVSVHTYPENNSLFADFFTCGTKCNPKLGLEFMKESLSCDGRVLTFRRG
jgi:S-adenosylmethionine decarboxylase